MAAPTAQEQLILELINRARLDPAAEAARLGIDLNQGLAPGTISPAQKQPLAFNPLINDAADSHSNWMLATDIFSHTGAGGSDPGDRMVSAGYVFSGSWTWGENIHWSGTTGTLNLNAAAVKAHDDLFKSAGHRANMLNGDFREAGIGAVTGQFRYNNVNYNALMTTENFALSGSNKFITGVVYNDTDNNDFYSVGEGLGGIDVAGTASWSSGGYTISTTASGPITLQFSGGPLAATAEATVTIASDNVKVDLVDGATVLSSATTAIAQAALNLTLLGLANINGTGSNAANVLVGNKGDNVLSGGDGNDTLNGGEGNDTLDGGTGADAMTGGAANDTYFVDHAGDSVIELLGQGYDIVNTSLAAHALSANVERLNATGSANFVGTGNALDNRFQSLGGDDRFIDIAGGADIFSGGAGTDTLDFRGSALGVILDFASNVHGGAAAGDTYASIEKFLGSNTAADTMTGGGTGRFLFVGGGGDDGLTGGVKNDQLIGQAGNDTLIGGADRDSLDGGTGDDTMTGGTQGDVFVFTDATFGQDTITDFQDGLDSFKIHSAVADDIADFTIDGNGTNAVTLALIANPGNTITLNGTAPITLSSADFLFY